MPSIADADADDADVTMNNYFFMVEACNLLTECLSIIKQLSNDTNMQLS